MALGRPELKARLLEFLKMDERFRYAVAGLLGLEEILKAIRSLQEQVAENTRAIRVLQEQVAELREDFKTLSVQVAENTKAIRELREDMNKLRADVFELWRIGQLYEGMRDVRPKLAIVSPFVREGARRK